MTVETTSVYTDPESLSFNAAWVYGALILIFLIGTVASVIFMQVASQPELIKTGAISAIGCVILALTGAFGAILEIRRQTRKREKIITKLDGLLLQKAGQPPQGGMTQ